MRSPRYTILIANRNTGAVRRLTVARLPVALAGAVVLSAVPLCSCSWASALARPSTLELESLRTTNETLKVENDSYRTRPASSRTRFRRCRPR